MPYKKEKRGSQWCVIKDGSGESMGCHDSEGKADRQLAALYANEPEAQVEALMNESFGTATDKHNLVW